SIWLQRRDRPALRAILQKAAVLVTVGLTFYLGEKLLIPSNYQALGMVSDTVWHRAFIGLGVHPDWPFGDLAAVTDCTPELPSGLVPGLSDSNGHCVYVAAVKHGAAPGPTYGGQYEGILRQAFFRVLSAYPWKVVQSYLVYKPLWIWDTLSTSANLS